ncbi:hypothetical protein ACTHQS_12985 [Arthrobacter sp. SAFR-044]
MTNHRLNMAAAGAWGPTAQAARRKANGLPVAALPSVRDRAAPVD